VGRDQLKKSPAEAGPVRQLRKSWGKLSLHDDHAAQTE
jgi:hypothetical protein